MINFIQSRFLFPFLPGRSIAFLAGVSLFLGIITVPASQQPAAIAATNVNISKPLPTRLTSASTNQAGATATSLSKSFATNGAPDLDDKYKLAIGDHLSFRILEDGDDPRPLIVTDSGDLEVPYIGRVPAENKTCRELAAEIKKALEKDYYYQATVVIAVDLMTKTGHGRVYLEGAVRLPGPMDIPADEVLTLSKAILRAGGFTDYADRRHVKISRELNTTPGTDGKETKKAFVVDVGEIFDKGKMESDLPLLPGDLIHVPDRLIRF